MKDEKYPNYLAIKEIALTKFDKEFVLDFAPRCYESSTTIEEFITKMSDIEKKRFEEDQNLDLNKLHLKILLLKVELLEIEAQKKLFIRQQQYDHAATIRDKQKEVDAQLLELKTSLELRFDNLEASIKDYDEKLSIKNVLLEFDTIDSTYKTEVAIQLFDIQEKLKSACDALRKEKRFQEASNKYRQYVETRDFLCRFTK